MATSRTAPTRSILIERYGEEPLIVEGIPATAKITYGPVQPGKQSYGEHNALRIYTSGNNQLAVFLNVLSFRDLSLNVKERKVTSSSESTTEVGPDGKRHDSMGTTSYEWVEVSA